MVTSVITEFQTHTTAQRRAIVLALTPEDFASQQPQGLQLAHKLGIEQRTLHTYTLSRRLFWQVFQEVTEEVSTVDPLRFGFKVQEQAKAQARQSHGANILQADMETPPEQGPHF